MTEWGIIRTNFPRRNTPAGCHGSSLKAWKFFFWYKFVLDKSNVGPLLAAVALDIQMNESLQLEGMARELVNRLQNIRKDLGFDVTDTIALTLRENDALADVLKQNKTYIQHEILATSITLVNDELEGSIPVSFDSLETNVNMVKSK